MSHGRDSLVLCFSNGEENCCLDLLLTWLKMLLKARDPERVLTVPAQGGDLEPERKPARSLKQERNLDRRRRRALDVPSLLISRDRTRSLLFPTRMIGVCGWDSLRRRRSWAVRWKLRLSVTEKTRTHTSHCSVDRSCGTKHINKTARQQQVSARQDRSSDS